MEDKRSNLNEMSNRFHGRNIKINKECPLGFATSFILEGASIHERGSLNTHNAFTFQHLQSRIDPISMEASPREPNWDPTTSNYARNHHHVTFRVFKSSSNAERSRTNSSHRGASCTHKLNKILHVFHSNYEDLFTSIQ